MKERGYTRAGTITEEQALLHEKPSITRVGAPAAEGTRAAPTAGAAPVEGMPQPSAAAKAPKVQGKKPPKVVEPGKEPGRFRLGKGHQQGRAKPKGRGGKAGILGGALVAAGMAEAARAAEPGKRIETAVKTGGKDLLTIGAMSAAAALVPAAVPVITGYVGYQTVRHALPTIGRAIVEGAKTGSAFYEAYRERKGSESKFGEAQYQAALAKQRKKGLL